MCIAIASAIARCRLLCACALRDRERTLGAHHREAAPRRRRLERDVVQQRRDVQVLDVESHAVEVRERESEHEGAKRVVLHRRRERLAALAQRIVGELRIRQHQSIEVERANARREKSERHAQAAGGVLHGGAQDRGEEANAVGAREVAGCRSGPLEGADQHGVLSSAIRLW